MGLSLSALTTAFLLLPGIAFMVAARRTGAGSDDASLTARGTLVALLLIGISSLVVHGICISALNSLYRGLDSHTVNFKIVGVLLHGADSDKLISQTFEQLGDQWIRITWYLICSTLLGLIFGLILEKCGVLNFNPGDNWLELEIKKSIKRELGQEGISGLPQLSEHEIDDLMKGNASAEVKDLITIWITLTVDFSDGTHLVFGEYLNSLTDTNSLDEVHAISLESALRRPLNGDISDWLEIPGEIFIVRAQKLQTINVDLVWELNASQFANIHKSKALDETASTAQGSSRIQKKSFMHKAYVSKSASKIKQGWAQSKIPENLRRKNRRTS